MEKHYLKTKNITYKNTYSYFIKGKNNYLQKGIKVTAVWVLTKCHKQPNQVFNLFFGTYLRTCIFATVSFPLTFTQSPDLNFLGITI